MAHYSSLKIHPSHKEILDALSKNYEITTIAFLHFAIEYFQSTGVDPRSRSTSFTDELEKSKKEILKSVKESRDTYIAFIRELESKKLSPIASNVQDIGNELLDYLKNKAPAKEDIKGLLSHLKNTGEQVPVPLQREPLPIEKYDRSEKDEADNARAKQLFREFLSHGKKTTFGDKISFEESTIEHYKGLFNQL